MTRPFYESDEDRANEEAIARKLTNRWKCGFVKLKPSLILDYACLRGATVSAFMECKSRNYSSEKLIELGGLMLSAHKWERANSMCSFHGLPFILAIQCMDGLFWRKFYPIHRLPLVLGGRTDREDVADLEPCVLVPFENFAKFDDG